VRKKDREGGGKRQRERYERDIKKDRDREDVCLIEGNNIEYGNIEKCNIDTILTSKILRLVTSKR